MGKISLILSMRSPIVLNRNFPYERAFRIAGDKTLIDRYFDERTSRALFLKYSKTVYAPLLSQAATEAERSSKEGKGFTVAIAASGIFFDLVRRYDMSILNHLKKLEALGSLEVLAMPYFHSLASLFPGGLDEFEEQVRMQMELMKKIFSVPVNILVNSHLIYNDKVARAAEALGLKGAIIEEVAGARNPPVYKAIGSEDFRLLTRNAIIGRAVIEGRIEELVKAGKVDGTYVLFLEAESLAERGGEYAKLVVSTLRRSGAEVLGPSKLIENLDSGTISIPEQLTTSLAEYGGTVKAWIGNPMQRLAFERMASLKALVQEAGDAKIKSLWRMLQQSDYLLSMGEGYPAYFNIFSSPAEAFAVYNSVYVDFEGKVATWVQKLRKSRTTKKNQYGLKR